MKFYYANVPLYFIHFDRWTEREREKKINLKKIIYKFWNVQSTGKHLSLAKCAETFAILFIFLFGRVFFFIPAFDIFLIDFSFGFALIVQKKKGKTNETKKLLHTLAIDFFGFGNL